MSCENKGAIVLNLNAKSLKNCYVGVSTAAQLSRRHQISPGLLYHLRRQYVKGAYENEPTKEAALEERVHQLEQMLGKVVLENEFLKKAVKKSLEENRKKEGV